ncbi:MAG: hypothetical protein HRT51_09025 [Colwellia sp.]|nr:hypothetical protein [Colwellia sp.]
MGEIIKIDTPLSLLQSISIEDIENTYVGRRRFKAKNDAYEFDLFSNNWLLELNSTIDLSSLSESGLSAKAELMLRRILAIRASTLAFGTVKNGYLALVYFSPAFNGNFQFQKTYNQASESFKQRVQDVFSSVAKLKGRSENEIKDYFSDIVEFLDNQEFQNRNNKQNIMHPTKGSYTDEEYKTLSEYIRTHTISVVEQCMLPNVRRSLDNGKSLVIARFSTVIMLHLLISLVRRPVQLWQMKWSDILPVGVSFSSIDAIKAGGEVENEQMFSDVEQFHIRTFKGKEGLFRKNVESRSHRIEPDLSTLLDIYRAKYQEAFKENLAEQGIELSKVEWVEIMFRSPVCVGDGFFKSKFNDKEELFSTLGHHSASLHPKHNNLRVRISALFITAGLSSERVSLLSLTNNRHRHTILTHGVLDGLSKEQLSCITGVTIAAVTPYLDLTLQARLLIDDAFAKQKMFKQFATGGVSVLQQQDSFKVLNEFDEEMGFIKKQQDCSSCKANIGKPLGCYGCDNFRPFFEADHSANLNKLERKLELNKDSTPNTLKPIQRAIIFARATISVCNDIKLSKKGLANGD